MFSENLIHLLITGSLVWTGAGALVLLVLLVIDHFKKSIW